MNYYYITGTSSGIGRALVEEIVKQIENQVIGLSRTNTLREKQFRFEALDLSDFESVSAFTFQKIEKEDKVVLINNAGTLGEIEYIGKQKNQNIQDVMQVNFTSAAILMNKFIQTYQHHFGEKIIVNISSGAATSPYDGWANYCSAKAALNIFTQVIHKEQQEKEHPVEAYAIAPGVVDTLMQDQIRSTSKDKFKSIDKFKDLKSNNQLYTTQAVAKRLVEMIQNSSEIPGVISRISL